MKLLMLTSTLSFSWKFRRFNDGAKLSLRELLASAETIQRLDNSVWEFVQNESSKVLLIFDGLDEYSRKEEINTQEDYKNDVEEKMPVSVLYKKLAAGRTSSWCEHTRDNKTNCCQICCTCPIVPKNSRNPRIYVRECWRICWEIYSRLPRSKGENIGPHQVQR